MAKYSLESIRQAAKAGHVQFHGRRAGVDAAELGYQLGDIIACILAITTDEFSKTLSYTTGPDFDVYLTKYKRPCSEDEQDELYVKLALINDELILSLASFHLQRF